LDKGNIAVQRARLQDIVHYESPLDKSQRLQLTHSQGSASHLQQTHPFPDFLSTKVTPLVFQAKRPGVLFMGLFVRSADELLRKEFKRKRYGAMVVGNT